MVCATARPRKADIGHKALCPISVVVSNCKIVVQDSRGKEEGNMKSSAIDRQIYMRGSVSGGKWSIKSSSDIGISFQT